MGGKGHDTLIARQGMVTSAGAGSSMGAGAGRGMGVRAGGGKRGLHYIRVEAEGKVWGPPSQTSKTPMSAAVLCSK